MSGHKVQIYGAISDEINDISLGRTPSPFNQKRCLVRDTGHAVPSSIGPMPERKPSKHLHRCLHPAIILNTLQPQCSYIIISISWPRNLVLSFGCQKTIYYWFSFSQSNPVTRRHTLSGSVLAQVELDKSSEWAQDPRHQNTVLSVVESPTPQGPLRR